MFYCQTTTELPEGAVKLFIKSASIMPALIKKTIQNNKKV